jgi:hypothetical protein
MNLWINDVAFKVRDVGWRRRDRRGLVPRRTFPAHTVRECASELSPAVAPNYPGGGLVGVVLRCASKKEQMRRQRHRRIYPVTMTRIQLGHRAADRYVIATAVDPPPLPSPPPRPLLSAAHI